MRSLYSDNKPSLRRRVDVVELWLPEGSEMMTAPRPSCEGWIPIREAIGGPRFWQAFRDSVAHIYDTVSLPDPSEEARFTLSTRAYATPRGIFDAL